MADGLATWMPRLSVPSDCLRIEATAGSGKTLMAMRLQQDAVAHKKNALYVCLNRALADHVARLAPRRVRVADFHELCIDHFQRAHGTPDSTDRMVFEHAGLFYGEVIASKAPVLDILVVDEGHHFEPAWLDALVNQPKPDGMLYLMEDQNQRLYERDEFELDVAVRLSCRDNFRSPRAVCS